MTKDWAKTPAKDRQAFSKVGEDDMITPELLLLCDDIAAESGLDLSIPHNKFTAHIILSVLLMEREEEGEDSPLSRFYAALSRHISGNRARVEELQNLCAALYQFAGEVGAPERVLDVLAAAQHGDRISQEAIDAILPVTADECDAVKASAQRMMGRHRKSLDKLGK